MVAPRSLCSRQPKKQKLKPLFLVHRLLVISVAFGCCSVFVQFSKTLSECVRSLVKEFILTNGPQLELRLLHLEVSVLVWLWLIVVGLVPFPLD